MKRGLRISRRPACRLSNSHLLAPLAICLTNASTASLRRT
jgi:hypothetical protein